MSESSTMKDRVGGVLKDRVSRKFIIFAGVIIAAAVSWTMFGGSPEVVTPSQVPSAPAGLPSVQGGAPVNPAYEHQLEEEDRRRAEAAREDGSSSLPTIRGRSSENLLPDLTPEPVETPKGNRKGPEPEIVRPALPSSPESSVIRRPVMPAPAPAPRRTSSVVAKPDEEMVSAMQQQMAGIMGTGTASVASVETLYVPQDDEDGEADDGIYLPAPEEDGGKPAVDVPLAGTVLYAALSGRVDSDTPGPVRAEILEGPLAGAILIGQFQAARDTVVISFDRMTVFSTRDGHEVNETFSIDAVAVDPKHLSTGLASDVDRHLFEKMALGFATAFVEGLGNVIANQGQVVIDRADGSSAIARPELETVEQLAVAGGEATGAAGQVLSSEYGNRPTTITVDADVPIGIMFL